MINSLNSLNELSDIYLGSINEADNSPEAVKARVMQHVRAIRYRARKEGETLNKAYNEFMGSQSGISSTEKQMVKERLGLTGGSSHVGEETSLKDMRRASTLSVSDNPKDQDEARKIKTQMDYESLMSKKKVKKESFSNWRSDLREIASDIPVDEKQAEKKVKEKKINNKITINPAQGQVESFAKALGGEVLELYEVAEVDQEKEPEDLKAKSSADREKRMKVRLLRLKMMGARQGVEGIVAGYEPDIEGTVEYFFEEGINEEGIDQLIEEIGLDEFVDFVEGGAVELNEERSARKASVRAKSYEKVKAEVDKADAAKKAAKKGEYAPSYAKKETDVTVYDDKPTTKKKAPAKKPVAVKKPVTKKVVKAVAKVKKTQPAKKPSKQGLADKISAAYKKGVERHKKARAAGRVPEKRAKEFGKGLASGVKTAVKFAKDVKKVVSEEELLEKDSRRTVDAIRAYDRSKDASRDATSDSDKGKKGKAAKERKYAAKERGEIKKDDPNWKSKKYHTGMHGESLELQDADGNVAYQIVDVIKAPVGLKKTELIPAVAELVEKDLNAKERRALPDKDFALPGKGEGPKGKQAGSYPIPDEKHARSALSLVAQHGTSAEKATVRAKVKKKFPGIKISEDKALDLVRASIIKKHGKGAIYDPKKKQSPEDKAKVAAERQKRDADKAKALSDRAKKAGYKSTQDYVNVVARYGSEDNYNKGKGLGS